MFPRALRLVRIAGVDVRLDPSLLVFAALIVWTFTGRFRPSHGLTVALTMALVGTICFLGSILAHELAHALEARHRGMHVEGVTLFLFGGVTEMHAHGQTARDELAVAAVGPYVSLVCAALLGLLATFASDLLPAAVATPVATVAGLLGWLNLALALFNLIPGAPLDGGRVLRAVLWLLLHDRMLALRVSVRAGQALAIALVAGAGWLLLRVPGSAVSALLTAAIGVFLYVAARKELQHAVLDELLTEHTVGQLFARLDVPAPAPAAAVPDGPADAPAGPATAQPPVVADDAALPAVAPAPAVEVTDDLHVLIDRFQDEQPAVRVVRDGELLGTIDRATAAHALADLRDTVRRGTARRGATRRRTDRRSAGRPSGDDTPAAADARAAGERP
jgi:Zn-dependent protease